MNNRLKSLVKKILITATAAISSAPVVASTTAGPSSVANNPPAAKFSQENFEKSSKHPKLVLEKPSRFNLGSYLLAVAHVSHSSHSSHVSHASHASGYTQPQPPPPAPEPDQNQGQITKQSADQGTKDQTLYKLGSRTLKRDMTGTDVAELQQLLIKKGYKTKITANYDSTTEDAVKRFQKKKNIRITGEVDALTLFYLIEE